MQQFREDPKCMVFLSTDAGGVGLNLQAASAVINFEPPWNPAKLEQRIGRVHRMGQVHPVQVIHMLTEDSIEERVWETIRLKRALFSGLFDSSADEVSFEKLGRQTMLRVVQETFSDEADRPKPDFLPPERETGPLAEKAPDEEHAASVLQGPAASPHADVQPSVDQAPSSTSNGSPGKPVSDTGMEQAVAGLVEAGVRFLEAFAGPPQPAKKTEGPAQGVFSNLVRSDPQTNRQVMAIPLPDSLNAERLEQAIGGLLRKLSQGV